MKKWNRPKNKEEFQKLLEGLNEESRLGWESMEYNDRNVALFLFLQAIWNDVPNPNKAEEFVKFNIEYYRKIAEEQPNRKKYEPPSVDILHSWIKKGIDPKEICMVLRDAHIDATYRVFGLIEHSYSFMDVEGMTFGIFLADLDENFGKYVPKGSRSLEDEATEALMSVMPGSHPPMPQWC